MIGNIAAEEDECDVAEEVEEDGFVNVEEVGFVNVDGFVGEVMKAEEEAGKGAEKGVLL
jgi:hypothetical protein